MGHPALQVFALDFHRRMAKRNDNDARLAYVQIGFGLWAEHHIYDGPFVLGKTFPDFADQKKFLQTIATYWQHTPWMISVDAADGDVTLIANDESIRGLSLGIFGDIF